MALGVAFAVACQSCRQADDGSARSGVVDKRASFLSVQFDDDVDNAGMNPNLLGCRVKNLANVSRQSPA